MYDRPSITELITAAIQHFEEKIIPVARETNHQLYFQTLVAINVMRIAEREMTSRPAHLRAEWTRLNMLMGKDLPDLGRDDDLGQAIRDANTKLCARIRNGEYDKDHALFQHLKARSIEQLEVANPKFLQAIQMEDDVH